MRHRILAACVAFAILASPSAARAAPAPPPAPAGGLLHMSPRDPGFAEKVRQKKPTTIVDEHQRTPSTLPNSNKDTAPEDCAAVRSRMAELARSGRETATCVTRVPMPPAALTAPKVVQPSALAAATGWDIAPDSGKIPSWCPRAVGVYEGRMRECHIDSFEYIIFKVRGGQIVGRALLAYFEWEEMSNKRRTWTHEIRMNVYESKDLALDSYLYAEGWCGLNCQLTTPEEKKYVRLRPGTWMAGSWPMGRDGAPDRETMWGMADTELYFLAPGVEEPFTHSWTEVSYHNRCDSTLAETPKEGGCAFNEVIPDLVLDKTNEKYGLHAQFVERAQQDTPDHFGARGLGQPLQRLTDEERITDNRNVSCAGFVKDPNVPGDSCDEYPYASTYQGANEIGRARVAVGHVPLPHNREGGNALKSFLLANRVIDGDKYWVTPTVGTGGDAPGRDMPPTVRAGDDVLGREGSAVQLNGSADDEQGPPAVHWSYAPSSAVDPGTTCSFSDPNSLTSTFTCNDDGTFTVTLTADDGVNAPVSDSLEATISNVSPGRRPVPELAASADTGIAPARWSLFRVGDTVPLSVPYLDPGSNDTQTCVVDWDDSRSDTYPGTGSDCDRPHVYTAAGMYTITVRITDDDGGSDIRSTMVIVYDPAAGVGRGNGWLNAPGNTAFDFTSSYPTRAATVPDGAVTFALPPAANLNLRNHQQLDWLVVTPDGKVAVKGTAERIPGQRVSFVLYGYDGCPTGQTTGCQVGPDKLRMVVWDSATHGPVPDDVPTIYDNRAGSSFDVDAANPQVIDSGVIQILHPPI
jgi:hypothetical protein